MARNDLPDAVKQLLRDDIHSLEQLEVLLLLREQGGVERDAHWVNVTMRSSETSAAARLADLEQRGFLKARLDGERNVYAYQPANDAMRTAIDLLARAYAERRYTVIELIFSKPLDGLRVYAGAFRFKKEDDDG